MRVVTAALYEMVSELDVIFQSALDRMESQARDAYVLEQALKRVLADTTTGSVLGWDVEKAITPLAAYQALAFRIIDELPVSLGLPRTPQRHQYADLLVWPDEPKRTGDLLKDFEARVQYARKLTLRHFVDLAVTRFAPDTDPDLSATCAASDLLRAFVIALPQNLVVPVQDAPTGKILPMMIRRLPDEVRWVMPHISTQIVARTNYAISTLARLHGKGVVATRMAEMTRDFQAFITKNFGVYEARQTFHGGAEVTTRLLADWVDYEVSEELFRILRDAMASEDSTLAFVPAASLFSDV